MNIRTIQVAAYTDPQGLPTCSADVTKQKFCEFYRVSGFGTRDTCVFADHGQTLERRGDLGFLIPLKNCPVWKDHGN